MRFYNYMIMLVVLPFVTFAQHPNPILRDQKVSQPNTIVKIKSNEAKPLKKINAEGRTIDFPTQIIRMKVNVEALNLSCDQVIAAIDEKLLGHILEELFIYNTYTFCQYTDESEKAIAYEINSYFDPINDKAVEYTNNFIKEYNGSDLLGGKVQIESATGLVVSLNVTAGIKKNPDSPPFIVYRQDHNDFYFKSNYEMRIKLITDIYDNFYSNDPTIALPFYDRWFSDTSAQFAPVLKEANYVELFPDRIFIMNQGGDIFVSNL
ncbi:MAG: hypothetical protein EPN84_11070, partial [Legionella sp.]